MEDRKRKGRRNTQSIKISSLIALLTMYLVWLVEEGGQESAHAPAFGEDNVGDKAGRGRGGGGEGEREEREEEKEEEMSHLKEGMCGSGGASHKHGRKEKDKKVRRMIFCEIYDYFMRLMS